ncbi:hypothetical protein JCM15519_27620 [Fundidesulfovibrio butyratiphilus]
MASNPPECGHKESLPVPDHWRDLNQRDAVKSALKPIYAFAMCLDGGKSCPEVDGKHAGEVLGALVERAEVILGHPDVSWEI